MFCSQVIYIVKVWLLLDQINSTLHEVNINLHELLHHHTKNWYDKTYIIVYITVTINIQSCNIRPSI